MGPWVRIYISNLIIYLEIMDKCIYDFVCNFKWNLKNQRYLNGHKLDDITSTGRFSMNKANARGAEQEKEKEWNNSTEFTLTFFLSTSFCLVFTCKYLLERLIGHEIQNEHVKLNRNWINRIFFFSSFQLHHYSVCIFINDMLLCVGVSDTYVHYRFIVWHFFLHSSLLCTLYMSAVCFYLIFFFSFSHFKFCLWIFHKFYTIKTLDLIVQ